MEFNQGKVKHTGDGLIARLSSRLGYFRDQHYWLYALASLPLLTGLIEEHGRWPLSLLEWTTEVGIGVVIAGLAHQIRLDYQRLSRLARTDGLTGLLNRRSFDNAIEAECTRSRRTGSPLTILLLDLDRFKQINDRLGHHVGDQVLKCVARSISGVVRAGIDQGFRLGGDEFAVLLPGSTEAQAYAVVQRLREDLRKHSNACSAGSVSVSIGTIEYSGAEAVTEFVRRADAAMYSQKFSRR